MRKIEWASVIIFLMILTGTIAGFFVKLAPQCGGGLVEELCSGWLIDTFVLIVFIIPESVIVIISIVELFLNNGRSLKEKLLSLSLAVMVVIAIFVLHATFNLNHTQIPSYVPSPDEFMQPV